MRHVHVFACQHCEAAFSDNRLYRYWLARDWGFAAPFGVFLCHNPSLADALWMDHTAMCCGNLAVQWKWRGFGIVNVVPIVSTDLAAVRAAIIPADIAHQNDDWLRRARRLADIFVIATGAEGHPDVVDAIGRLSLHGPFHAIHKNKDDGYLHPSRVSDPARFPAPIPVNL